jgi:hypothetical protein
MMSVQTVTLNVPDMVYQQIRRAAEKMHRPVNDLLVEAVIAAAPVANDAPLDLRSALAQMAFLNDAALWQAARATMTPTQRTRLEALHEKQQREGLSAAERSEDQALLSLYRETILLRAQAAMLLKQRGYDISDATQFFPIE